MPKYRSQQQMIGSAGEADFRTFAEANNLIPTKVDDDFGTDFLCIPTTPDHASKKALVSGVVIGAAVRTTTQRTGRIQLTRDDVGHLLQAEYPIFLVLIARSSGAPIVSFRLVDGEFYGDLARLLMTRRKRFSFQPRDLKPGLEFRAAVERAMSPGFVEQTRIAAAQAQMQAVIPRSRLRIERRADGSYGIIEVENVYDMFRRSNTPEIDDVYVTAFGAPHLHMERLSKLKPRDELLVPTELVSRSLVIRAGDPSRRANLVVEGPDGSGSCRMDWVSTGAHHGYRHSTGFALTISARKKKGAIWVHEFHASIDSQAPLEFPRDDKLFAFLAHCVPGAKVHEEGDGHTWDVEMFRGLPAIAWAASYLLNTKTLRLPNECSSIAGVPTEEDLNSLAWLAFLAKSPNSLKGMGLVVGGPAVDECEKKRARGAIPVVGNYFKHSIVTWLDAEVDVLAFDGTIRGFVVRNVTGCSVETGPRRTKSSLDPEVVVVPDWPTFSIGARRRAESDPSEWGLKVRLQDEE